VSEQHEAISTAKGLTGALADVGKELRRLNAYGRRNRKLAWVAGVVAVAAIALAFVLIARVHATQISACEVGNQSRAQQVALWEHVAGISAPAPGETAARRRHDAQVLAAFLGYVHKVFAAKNCAALYRLP
jgi:hypothetical protein